MKLKMKYAYSYLIEVPHGSICAWYPHWRLRFGTERVTYRACLGTCSRKDERGQDLWGELSCHRLLSVHFRGDMSFAFTRRQTLHQVTSTAELLNVRHAGAGLMYGKARGPVERLPWGDFVSSMYSRFSPKLRISYWVEMTYLRKGCIVRTLWLHNGSTTQERASQTETELHIQTLPSFS